MQNFDQIEENLPTQTSWMQIKISHSKRFKSIPFSSMYYREVGLINSVSSAKWPLDKREFKIPVRAQHVRQIKGRRHQFPLCRMFEVEFTSTEREKPVLQVLKNVTVFLKFSMTKAI